MQPWLAWLLGAAVVAAGAVVWIRVRWRRRGRPRPTAPKGRPYPTAAGIWVRSYGEQRVANALAARGLSFEYEPHVLRYRPDFRVGTRVLIEYWGGAAHRTYEEQMLRKIAAYEEAGWVVISIFPAHLHELGRVLDRQLAAAGITW